MTFQPVGTRISMPPHTASTSITASSAIRAGDRSISQPPITATASPRSKFCDAILRLFPAITAMAPLMPRSPFTPFLLRLREHRVDERAERHSGAEDDQQQRPGVAECQTEEMQDSGLQPHANGDHPETAPRRPSLKEVGHSEKNEHHRPVVTEGLTEI